MANRSYLYSFSTDKNGKPNKYFDISEQKYEIPIIYTILVSSNTKVVTSVLFENSLALVGDAKEGRKRLEKFFVTLQKKQIFEQEELQGLINHFLEHLDKYELDYFLFEPVEVLAMDSKKTDKEVKLIATECKNIDKTIKRFFKEASNDYWYDLGIDAFNFLYFNLGNKKEIDRIEKAFEMQKKARLKAEIKKPTVQKLIDYARSLDNKKDINEKIEVLNQALTLNRKPTANQLWDIAYYQLDLDKKIEVFKLFKTRYPNHKKTADIEYWIGNAYKEKEDYKQALNYYLEYFISRKTDKTDFLNGVIKKGKFNKEEIYTKLDKQLENVYVKEELIKLDIEKGNVEKAYKSYIDNKELLKTDFVNYHIIWTFLNNNYLDIAMQIIEDEKEYTIAGNYFRDKKDFEKAFYYFIKSEDLNVWQLIWDHTEYYEYKEYNINIKKIFESIYPKITDFNAKTIIKIAKGFNSDDVRKEFKSKKLCNHWYKIIRGTYPYNIRQTHLSKSKKNISKNL